MLLLILTFLVTLILSNKPNASMDLGVSSVYILITLTTSQPSSVPPSSVPTTEEEDSEECIFII